MGNKIGNVTSPDFNPNEWQVKDTESSQNDGRGIYLSNQGNFSIL